MYNFDVNKLYADIVYVMNSLDGIVSKKTLNRRKYIRYLDIVDECCKNKDKIKLKENTQILKQLANCQKCKCFKCNNECITDGCNRCESDGLVSQCDNEISTIYNFENKTLKLKSKKLKSTELYRLLAIIQDIEYNQYFVVLSLGTKKFIAYYYPEVGGDTFSEIKDIEDFNFAIKVFEDSEAKKYE